MRPRVHNFAGGLQTTRLEQTSSAFWFPTFQNVRVDKGAAVRRPGCKRIARVAASSTILDLDGTNDYVAVPYDSRIWVLRTKWTLEWLEQNDTLTGTDTIFGQADAAPGVVITRTSASGGSLIADVWDSAATQSTLTLTGLSAGTVVGAQLKRDGATLTLTANGSSTTATMSATLSVRNPAAELRIGSGNGANFFDGRIDFFRCFKTARAGTYDAHSRLTFPQREAVMADYVLEQDAQANVIDRSRWGNHGLATGTPATTATFLAINPAPIWGLVQNRTQDGSRKVYIAADTRIIPADLA